MSLRLCGLALKRDGDMMNENELSRVIVESAIEVHRTLGGPGLLESIYEEAMIWELQQRDIAVEQQRIVPIVYKGEQ